MTGSAEAAANPFVGPRPFEAGERLWGRDREIRELDNEISSERIVMLCSPSGAGKSSLVEAGLVPRLAGAFDVWGPTRVNQPATVAGSNRYVLSALLGLEEGVPGPLRRAEEVLAGQTLVEYAANRPRRRSAPRPRLLIFDQFEEILTVDPLAVEAKRELFDQLGQLLRDPWVWALFVLREEYLVALDPYARHIPTHLTNRFRIDLLGLDAAREAMVNPAHDAGRAFPAAEQLVHDLATLKVQQSDGSFAEETGPYVEPVQLQVVCRRLWDVMPEEDRSIDAVDLERFGDVNEALAGYYSESVARVAGGETVRERVVRRWFDDRLITAGGIRGQVLRGAGDSEGLANEVVDQLLDSHLVRAEQRTGATWYELAHDRLIEPVRGDNAAWRERHLSTVQRRASLWERQGRPPGLLLEDEELAGGESWAAADAASLTEVERDFLEQSRLSQDAAEREQRQARRIRRLAIVATVVSVLAIAAGVYAMLQTLRVGREAAKAVAVSDFLVGLFEEVDPEQTRGEEVTAREILDLGADKIDLELGEQPEVRATVQYTLGQVYMSLGLYDRAQPYVEAALATREGLLGREAAETLSSMSDMGRLLQQQGKYTEAELYLRDALVGRRRVLGEDDPDTFESIDYMGSLLSDRGSRPEAEPYYQESLAGRRRVLGDDHPDTLASIRNLGWLLFLQGKYAEAEPYQREAHAGYRRVLGDDHPDTLASVQNMGVLLGRQGKYTEAEPYQRESLAGRRHVLGDDHPDTLTSMYSLGWLLFLQGKYAEAEPYAREALTGLRRVLGDDHPDTLQAMGHLGGLLIHLGKLNEGELYFHEVLAGSRRALGDDHPDTLTSINNMGWLLFSQDRLTEAEPYYREALAGYRRALGDDHHHTLIAMSNLGALYSQLARHSEAEALLVEALESARQNLPREHGTTGLILRKYGACLTRQKRHSEAEAALLEAHEVLTAAVGVDHAQTLKVLPDLVDLFTSWGKPDKAAEWRARVPAE